MHQSIKAIIPAAFYVIGPPLLYALHNYEKMNVLYMLLLWVRRDAANLRRLFLQCCWVQPNWRWHLDGRPCLQTQELPVCHCSEVEGQYCNYDFLVRNAPEPTSQQSLAEDELKSDLNRLVCGSGWAASFSLITISPDISDGFERGFRKRFNQDKRERVLNPNTKIRIDRLLEEFVRWRWEGLRWSRAVPADKLNDGARGRWLIRCFDSHSETLSVQIGPNLAEGGCRNVTWADLCSVSEVTIMRKYQLGHVQFSEVSAVSRIAQAQACLCLLPGGGRLDPGSCTSERHSGSEKQLKPKVSFSK